MRRPVTPTVPPSMYRHFAIVTLAVTAGLAMFADGENQQAQAAQVTQSRPVPAEAPAPLHTAAPRQPASDWSDGDSGGAFGSPMDLLNSAGTSSSIMPDFDQIAAPGYSPDYLASLSEEERRLVLQGLQENGMLTPDIRDEQLATLETASSRRSGAAVSGE